MPVGAEKLQHWSDVEQIRDKDYIVLHAGATHLTEIELELMALPITFEFLLFNILEV
jgi:hypothetical protein